MLLATCDPGGGTLGEADIEQSAPLGVNSTLAVNSTNTDGRLLLILTVEYYSRRESGKEGGAVSG